MNVSSAFVRFIFVLLSVIFMISFAIGSSAETTSWTYLWGTILGLVTGGILIAIDILCKRYNLRAFNTAIIGLFFGYLMAQALLLIFNAIIDITGAHPGHIFVEVTKIFLFLLGTYLGVMMTVRSADEIYVSIPFVKFTPTAQVTKDLLLDLSALSDPRIIDLAASGLLNKRLVIPRFLLKDLYSQEEDSDEMTSAKAKRLLETVRKLETVPDLNIRFQETDFPEEKDASGKVLRLARLLDADVLSAEINRIQMAEAEGVRVINIHALSKALKPLMQKGEHLKIKILRQGKEEMQGVGYLEDGTMVVVNGAGDHIGETIAANVISVRHTPSGRMIFCNISEEGGYEEEYT
jgi:uncharacterized protein YacL